MSLPSGYRQLEYIKSTGMQYVDTNVVPSLNHGFKVRFQPSDLNGDNIYIGCATSGSQYWGGETYNAEHAYMWNHGATVSGTVFVGQTYTTSLNYKNDRKFIVDGVVVASLSAVSITTTPIRIFGFNNGSTSLLFRGKIFGVEITFNDEVICDFIPCQKPDGTIGLWDNVNSVFYGNAGTGTFTAGPITIAIAADETEITKLAYIQSSGTQFIDTGFKPNQNTTIVAEFEVLDASNNGAYLYGGGTGTARLEAYPWNGKLEFNYGSATPFVGTVYANKRFYICQDKTKYTLSYFDGSGEWTGNHAEQSFTSAYTLAIFALNRGTVAYPTAGMKLYSCLIYDNGTLIRDYIPAKLSDGTVGLYDKLNGLLYINAGTGTFEAGPNSLNLPVNIGGTWKDANEAFVNIGGTWKTVKDAFVNIGGAWKKIG